MNTEPSIDWALTLSTIVDICGVLGFILSIIVAVFGFRRYVLNVTAADVRIIPAGETRDAAFWIDAIIVNSSELPLSIIDVFVRIDGKRIKCCDSIYRFSKDYSDGVSVSFSVATPLPFHLLPYHANRLVVAIPRQQTALKQILQAEEHGREPVVDLIFRTSRRDVRTRQPVRFVSTNAYLTYRAAAEKVSL